jgi:cytochrome c-type biogenesis protein CcmH/NrfG
MDNAGDNACGRFLGGKAVIKMMIFYACMLGMLGLAFLFVAWPLTFFTKNKLNILFIFLLIAIFSVGFYGFSGGFKAYREILFSQKAVQQLPNVQSLIQQMEAHLQKNPTSSEGFYLLGRLYLSQQNFSKAYVAFEKANQLKPHDEKILFNEAQSLWALHDARAKAILVQVIKLNPDNDAAMNLYAIMAYQEGAYEKAIKIWEDLSEKYADDSEERKIFLAAIAKAQKNQREENKK